MKKILVLLLTLTLALGMTAFAESSTDYEALLAEKEARIVELETRVAELEALLEAQDEEPAYPVLEVGSKGDDVKKLQARLIELNYLSGSADGIYGNGTSGAVSAFQSAAGLSVTGVADVDTQTALFAEDAPVSKEYVSLDYTANARDPEAYKGKMIKFSGKILQVMESGSKVIFRIATKSNGYDDVVYCTYYIPDDYKRFLEDDRVNVWGVSTGVYSYETVLGSTVTIPSCTIDRIELK